MKFGYSPPRQIAENLWEIRGEWSNKFGRRMTVIRLADGRVVVHNAIELKPEDLRWLKSLGPVAFVLAPNVFHCSDAGWMAKETGAPLYVPRKKFRKFAKFHPRDINQEFPALPDLKCIPMQGTRISEAAFYHTPSRTLILCDLAFHMRDEFTGFEKVFMRWNKVGGRFGPSRLTKLLFAKDRYALIDSFCILLAHDFDRVIVNHGEILETGGRERLRDGVIEIFGTRNKWLDFLKR